MYLPHSCQEGLRHWGAIFEDSGCLVGLSGLTKPDLEDEGNDKKPDVTPVQLAYTGIAVHTCPCTWLLISYQVS